MNCCWCECCNCEQSYVGCSRLTMKDLWIKLKIRINSVLIIVFNVIVIMLLFEILCMAAGPC